MKKVLITGSTGLVGSRIATLWQDKFQLITPKYEDGFDITEKDSLNKILDGLQFDFVLHLAAYTNVDKAEEERELCYNINVVGVRNLFEVCQKKKAGFIYASTAFVFPGKLSENPYTEKSIPDPLGFYGKSKWAGEEIVKGKAAIARFDYPYRFDNFSKKDIFRTIKELLENKVKLKAVEDMKFNPTFIDDIARGLEELINEFSPGIYHLVGKDYTPYDAFRLICKYYDLDLSLVEPISFFEFYQNKAPRPQYNALKQSNLKTRFRSFEEVLAMSLTKS
ncbi:MAG: NAD(P)-dependent oxidoreductase [Patescibacteria group bacterium]|nr:MAG: NAD(P)-dependent oxidoreductase [Patescibacteria group bacterium]